MARVLDDVLAHLRRFVWFGRDDQVEAVTLWIAHTHAFAAVEQSPILAVVSPTKRSGKTRLFEVLETLVPRPWRIERPSEAVLFRRIERDQPTIFLDEADAIFADRSASFEGVRAVYNGGNRRGTLVSRTIPRGRSFDLVDFRIFCPKALAGIGRLPETIIDRSIVISMVRRLPTERVERLRHRAAIDLGAPLRHRLEAALADVVDVSLLDDALPPELDDRAQDNWESLIAVADRAGGNWPARARAAALALDPDRQTADEDTGIRLLADLRMIFDARAVDFMSSSEIITALGALEGAPWGDWRGGRPISGRGVADVLRPFGVRSEHTSSARGYSRRALTGLWLRYLSGSGEHASEVSEVSAVPWPAKAPVTEVTDLTPPGASEVGPPRAPAEPRASVTAGQTTLVELQPEWRCPVDRGSGHVPTLRGDRSIYCSTCHPPGIAAAAEGRR